MLSTPHYCVRNSVTEVNGIYGLNTFTFIRLLVHQTYLTLIRSICELIRKIGSNIAFRQILSCIFFSLSSFVSFQNMLHNSNAITIELYEHLLWIASIQKGSWYLKVSFSSLNRNQYHTILCISVQMSQAHTILSLENAFVKDDFEFFKFNMWIFLVRWLVSFFFHFLFLSWVNWER